MGVGFLLQRGRLVLTRDRDDEQHIVRANCLPGLILGGLGTAMLFIPLLIAVQTATTAEDAPQASSFITLAFQLGGSIASAILVTLIDRRGDFHYQVLGSAITPNNHAIQSGLQNVAPQQFLGLVVQQAQTLAFADMSYLVALVAALAIPLVFLMKKSGPPAHGVSFE